jgi:hypothetical protein
MGQLFCEKSKYTGQITEFSTFLPFSWRNLPPAPLPPSPHRPARQKVCGACVGGNLDRKSGWRSRVREDPGYSFRCIQVRMLIDSAQVIPLEVPVTPFQRLACQVACCVWANLYQELPIWLHGYCSFTLTPPL